MYLDEFAKGGGWHDPQCLGCRQPIAQGERAMRVTFNTGRATIDGLTGDYHLACAKTFASMARVLNFNPR